MNKNKKIIDVKYVYFMIYCNAQFIHFGDTKGHQGTLLTFLLHRSLAVLSIILILHILLSIIQNI